MEKKASYKGNKYWLAACVLLLVFSSCSFQQQIAKSAKAEVINNTALQTAHVGISIYDPAANKYLYNYQGDKYFVPASNTKIPTCYAAMKYLGDSLVGLRYEYLDKSYLIIEPTGDPSFLHSDFKNHPVFNFLKNSGTQQIILSNFGWKENSLGSGWSWNDFLEPYMAERSLLPIYGNTVKFRYTGKNFIATPKYFKVANDIIESHDVVTTYDSISNKFDIIRDFGKNNFSLEKSNHRTDNAELTFTSNIVIVSQLIKDTLGRSIITDVIRPDKNKVKVIHSQPTDSLLKPMMHRSDNFFAEQSLLMVSNETLGYMNDEKIIDTILKTDFKDLPQKPRWADGSGLSRYNLFTPQDFVAILNKMKNEFGMERLKVIFPTGGEGTISNYYKADSGYIYAKTGTLSGVVAFSGYLYTKKGKLLIFSTLVNNHQASATEIRKAVEKFIQGIRSKY